MTTVSIYADGRPTLGSVSIPYQGYEVSISTVFPRTTSTVVFSTEGNAEVLFELPGANAETIRKAFTFIENRVADERHAARREANTAW